MQVRWNPIYQKWITGSEDSTIRVWASNILSGTFFNPTQDGPIFGWAAHEG